MAYRVWDCEDERLVTTRSVILDERPPAPFCDVHPSSVPAMNHDDENDDVIDIRPSSRHIVLAPEPESMEIDTPEQDVTTECMDIAPINEPDPAVSHEGELVHSNPEQQVQQYRHGSTTTVRIRSNNISRVAGPSGRPGLPSPTPTTLVPRQNIVPHEANRIVFRGKSECPRVPRLHHSRLLADSANDRDFAVGPPLLTDGREENPSRVGNESDDGEPETKRPRFDSYKIALAAAEVPRTYAEAMASPRCK